MKVSYQKKQAGFKLLSALILAVLLALGSLPLSVAANTGSTLMHEESFASDRSMTGLFSSVTEFFHTGDWDIQEAKLILSLSATPLVKEEVSDLTVLIGDRPIHSQRIPLTQGEVFQTEITLPADMIREGANALTLKAYLRTNETDPCAEDIGNAAWLTVLADSYVSVRYQSRAKTEHVSDLYKQLTSIDALENHQSAVFLPENPSEAELTAAGYLLSGTSRNASLFYENMELLTAASEADFSSKAYGVFLCDTANLPEFLREKLSDEQLKATEEGSLTTALTVGNSRVLLVSAAKAENLVRAGQLFGYPAYMQQIESDWHSLSPDEKISFLQEEESTVRKLTESGAYMQGPFRQEINFTINGDTGRILKSGSTATLRFRYAENLDFDRSLVTILIDGIPVGSKRLSRELASGDLLHLELPANQRISSSFTLTAAFDLELQDLPCTARSEETPWAYVTPDSTVELYSEESDLLLFDAYPAPFVSGGLLDEVTAVLPDQIAPADLTMLSRMMTTIGRSISGNAGTLRICTQSELGDVGDRHLIAIGRYDQNETAKALNDQLFFSFSESGDTLLSNEKMKIDPDYGKTLGTAQLLRSPYGDQKHAVLIISGVTDYAMLSTLDYLGSSDLLWQLQGDGFVVGDNQAHFFRFKEDNKRAADLTVDPSVRVAAIAASGVLLLLILAAVVVLLRHRKGKRDRTGGSR